MTARGRGDGGDNPAYAIDREVEDIEALVANGGGTAYPFGHSSGAALAFKAALKLGEKVKALAMYETPYNDDAEAQEAWKMSACPQRGMRHAPVWPMFVALGPTLASDHIGVMGGDRCSTGCPPDLTRTSDERHC
jgi:pimeloyl-ACP methyl ester carboxylesterase